MRIRRAEVGDAQSLAELHVRAWQWAYRGQIPDTYLDGLMDTISRRADWRRETLAATASEQRTWAAVVDDRIVGFADTGPSRDADADETTAELYSIHVDEPVARQGIGRALVSQAVEDLRERGFRVLTLWVLDTNERARRFYEALGWIDDGTKKVDRRPDFELHEIRYRRD